MLDANRVMDTQAKLALITELARREPQCRFTSLAHLLNERFLADSYHALGRDRATCLPRLSPRRRQGGVDGVTWKEYGMNLNENLKGLVAWMKAKQYKSQPARRVYIPKDGQGTLVRYADDAVCLIQYQEDAVRTEQALKERFARYDLELHPEKTRVMSFGRYERENAKRTGQKPNTFDFLGFTHYCGLSRRGKFMVNRQTSRKGFAKRCREMNAWLRGIRNRQSAKEWWTRLRQKLRGHYEYYGISGNMRALKRYYGAVVRMVRKWLNRRSQRRIYYWKRFRQYLKRFPLPQPRITHNMFTLSPVR